MKITQDNFEEFYGPKPPQNAAEREELERKVMDSEWFKNTENEFSSIHIPEVSKEMWGGKPSRGSIKRLSRPVKRVGITYNTLTTECNTGEECIQRLQDIQTRDMGVMGKADIAYNFLIGGDGRVYEGRGWNYAPSLTEEQPNSNFNDMIDVAFIGNFEHECSPAHMTPALLHWVRENVTKGNIVEDYEYK